MPSVSVMEVIDLDLYCYGNNPGYNFLSRLAELRIIPYKCNVMIGKKQYVSHITVDHVLQIAFFTIVVGAFKCWWHQRNKWRPQCEEGYALQWSTEKEKQRENNSLQSTVEKREIEQHKPNYKAWVSTDGLEG